MTNQEVKTTLFGQAASRGLSPLYYNEAKEYLVVVSNDRNEDGQWWTVEAVHFDEVNSFIANGTGEFSGAVWASDDGSSVIISMDARMSDLLILDPVRDGSVWNSIAVSKR